MRNRGGETDKAWRRILLATAVFVALAVTGFLDFVTMPRLRAQAPTGQSYGAAVERPLFDAASIKLNKSGEAAYRTNIPLTLGPTMAAVGGLMSLTNMPLRTIIGFAYKLSVGQTRYLMPGLPSWVDSERFDIEARAAGNPRKEQFRLMVQSLLADRFKLAMHHDRRQLPIFAMVLSRPGKTGPQLTPHMDDTMCVTDGQEEPAPTPGADLPPLLCEAILFPGLPPSVPGRIKGGGRKVTLDYIGAFLTGFGDLDRPVVNRTDLNGTFDFWMELARPPSGPQTADSLVDPNGPTLLQALDEQLGLKLERQTGPVDVLVIDHIEQPSEN